MEALRNTSRRARQTVSNCPRAALSSLERSNTVKHTTLFRQPRKLLCARLRRAPHLVVRAQDARVLRQVVEKRGGGTLLQGRAKCRHVDEGPLASSMQLLSRRPAARQQVEMHKRPAGGSARRHAMLLCSAGASTARKRRAGGWPLAQPVRNAAAQLTAQKQLASCRPCLPASRR